MKIKNRFKKGAASFYIVAFSTLILMIVAISFATVIISEVERTSNDDLAQSAYDSALAGIEDAKLAYYNYQNCLVQNDSTNGKPEVDGAVSCSDILYYMDLANNSEGEEHCDTVWNILGRAKDGYGNNVAGGVVEVTNISNNMSQATTCITMTSKLKDYRGTLSASNIVDAIKLSFANDVSASEITSMSLRWFSKDDAVKMMGEGNDASFNYNDYNKGLFSAELPLAPPVISLTLLQTSRESGFTIDSFNRVDGERTDRGTLYFIPVSKGGTNYVGSSALVKSNDKTVQNDPIKVGCDESVDQINGTFACSVMIDLPKPIDGERSDDTFEVVISLPYGQPASEFMLEFYCAGGACGTPIQGESGQDVSIATMDGVQLEVDSTGRANDLYRRVMTRLKPKDDMALTVMGPLELLDSGGNDAGLNKVWTVTKEYNFDQ